MSLILWFAVNRTSVVPFRDRQTLNSKVILRKSAPS